MHVILRILKHMALVDIVTLPTFSLEQCAGSVTIDIWDIWICIFFGIQ